MATSTSPFRRVAATLAITIPLAAVAVAIPTAGSADVPTGSWTSGSTWGAYAGLESNANSYGWYGNGYAGGFGGGVGGGLGGYDGGYAGGDSNGYGYPGQSSPYGTSPYGTSPYGTSPYGTSPYGGSEQGDQSSGQTDATTASSAASSGLVMINTVLDYDQGEAAGTGLVIGSNGIVVTNHHVVQGATSIKVTTPAGKTYTATVLGYDTTHDVAVLKLQGASGLTTVKTDTTRPADGSKVDAIGNAEGEEKLTDASGTVINTSTPIDVTEDDGSTAHLTDLIEVSSDVVPGDSGGALRESNGDVVGMNVAASSGTSQVTGYAIPISRVLTVADQILAGTSSSTVTIGGGKGALGIEVEGDTPQIAKVDANSTAKAGLEAGDTITAIDGTSVTTTSDLTKALTSHQPGDSVKVTWSDEYGQSHSASVTLIAGPIG